MTQAQEYVQKVTDQVLANVRTAQAAAVSSVGFWTQTAQSLTPKSSQPDAAAWSERFPQPAALVDGVYDAFEKVIANQREFGHQLVAAAQSAPKPAGETTSAAKKK